MPSFQIHLAIAKRYIDKHEIQDKDAFFDGSLVPDFVRPKEKSHYASETHKEGLVEHLKAKVDLNRFLRENEIKTDYDKGVFLHLLADKIFFTEFFDEEILKSIDRHEFTKNLYSSYNNSNAYLQEKYQVKIKKELEERMKQDIEQSRKEKKMSHEEGKNIIPLDKLDAFIERLSDVNIEEYVKKE